MNTLYALLWKEAREILPKVLVAFALAAVVCLMRQNADFNRTFAAGFPELVTGSLMVMATVLAMDALARERGTGTLSFLLDKPVGSGTVTAIKFIVGNAGLLLVVLVAWATVYLDLASLEVNSEWPAYRAVTVRSVDYASMVALSFTQFSLLYALVFIGSVVTDNSIKGATLGIALVVVLGIFLTGPAMVIFPIFHRYPLVTIGLDGDGHLVRLAMDSARFWVKVLANLILTAAALAVAVVLMRRFREAILSWRTIGIGWGAAIVAVFAVAYVEVPWDNQRMPAGVLDPPAEQYFGDLAVQGELAYMTAGQGGIAVADLSNPRQMRLLGSTRPEPHKSWFTSQICVVDSLAYLVGWRRGLPSDSLGVVVFDVGEPAAPRRKGHLMFAASRKKWHYQFWGATEGGLLLVRERSDAVVAEAFALDAEGMPMVGDEQVIMAIPAPLDDRAWKRRCHVSVRGSRAYIGTERELVILDATDAHALRKTGRHTLESFWSPYYNGPRLVVTDGDKLFVERFWPHELVEFDITHPDQLREVEYLPLSRSNDIRSLLVVGGVVYGNMRGDAPTFESKIQEWRIAEYGALVEDRSWGAPEGLRTGLIPRAMAVANGYLYAISFHGRLLAYRVQ